MNKIGTLDIIKAYLGNKELSANNAYIGEIPLIKGSGPEPEPVPNDEIWYTSSDGNIVTPNDTTVLPTIVSNTYSDGKGVIKFASNVTSIGDDAFYDCKSLTSVTIPNSVTSIGNRAFDGCSGLTSITIPNSVTSIGEVAFANCSGLTGKLIIPNSVTSIGKTAFDGCSGLTSITIPNSVTLINEYTFRNCSGLTSVTIPNSVTSIGDYAFNGCTGLTSITIPNSVTSIGNQAFEYCTGLVSIIVKNGNTTFDSRNNCNAIIETSTNIVVFGCKNTTIPNNVVSIGNRAFANCTGLTSITIPNSVTSIGSYAFSNTGLTSIKIPNSVTSIAQNAFGGLSAKILFSKLYSTYTNKIFSTPINNTTYTYNVEFNISEIPTDYNISSMLPRHTGKKGTITYNIYTDYEPCKVQALALANEKTIVNVYHIDGTPWA